MRATAYLLISVVLLNSGCGRSGTWTDDSSNWQRAFQSSKPEEAVVVHSQYWRSPHFTLEFQYYFHIKANQTLHKQLLESNELTKVESKDTADYLFSFFGDKPEWFLPKPREKYDIWIYEGEPIRNFKVFIDKDNEDLFLTDYQI